MQQHYVIFRGFPLLTLICMLTGRHAIIELLAYSNTTSLIPVYEVLDFYFPVLQDYTEIALIRSCHDDETSV